MVVAGGGFAGLTAARDLCRSGRFDVRVVDRHNYFIFKPLLAEVASGAVHASDAVVPLRQFVTDTRPVRAEIVGLDAEERKLLVRYDTLDGQRAEAVSYDVLILALGSDTNFFGITGLDENALTLDTVGDALAIRGRILRNLERATLEGDPARRRALQTFVVGGGSFTGVEIAGAIATYLRQVMPFYPGLSPADNRIIVAEMKDRLLPALPDRMGQAALKILRRQGVEIRLGTAVKSLTDRVLDLSDGRVESEMVLWAGGITPVGLVKDMSIPTDRKGRVVVDEYLRVNGAQGIYACGDCAAVPDGAGGFQPATAQHARREGKYLADQIIKRSQGNQDGLRPFRYESAGMLVSLGSRRATGVVKGHIMSGFTAWLFWRIFYLSQLPTVAHRLRLGAGWAVNAFAGPAAVELPMFGRGDPRQQRSAESPAPGGGPHRA